MLFRKSKYLEVPVAIDTQGQLRVALKDISKEYQKIESEASVCSYFR